MGDFVQGDFVRGICPRTVQNKVDALEGREVLKHD